MSKNDYIIRLERKEEHREVEALVREAFWNVYRPGCLEHYVLNQLRNDEAFVPELDFVMVKDGKLIGQNYFHPAECRALTPHRRVSFVPHVYSRTVSDLQRLRFPECLQ